MIAKKEISLLLLFLSILAKGFSQNYITWGLHDSIHYEMDALIDSIWMEVVRWDGDISVMAITAREQQASDLETYGSLLDSEEKRKSYLYSYFIRFRNEDYKQIISKFE